MITRYDKALILSIILVAILLFLSNLVVLGKSAKEENCSILIVSDKANLNFSFDQQGLHPIKGPLGETIVEVSGDGVRVISSPCPNHDCVSKGWIRSQGEAIICAPNQIMIRITSQEDVEMDALNG
ncbi:MAG: NusG domain II-containing protein [Actinomycetota bacterium]|nr:NusG domain II-containing protein [Actinomycetota bacterium]